MHSNKLTAKFQLVSRNKVPDFFRPTDSYRKTCRHIRVCTHTHTHSSPHRCTVRGTHSYTQPYNNNNLCWKKNSLQFSIHICQKRTASYYTNARSHNSQHYAHICKPDLYIDTIAPLFTVFAYILSEEPQKRM